MNDLKIVDENLPWSAYIRNVDLLRKCLAPATLFKRTRVLFLKMIVYK